jgi:hypothetical protein
MGDFKDSFNRGQQDAENGEDSPVANAIGAVIALVAMLGLLYVAAYIIGAGLHAGGLG